MKDILKKLLGKRGIETPEELDSEEKKTFENWERVLSKEKLTVEDVEKFLEGQIGMIEAKWRSYEYDKKEKLIPYHTVYKIILEAIRAPQKERENLERHLHELYER